MAGTRIFDFVVDELERATGLGRPAARAAVRSVIERALYDPAAMGAGQMQLLIERLLPSEIRRSGVEDAEPICRQLAAGLAAKGFAADDLETPDEIFSRMIRR